jgi:hypothetical protein
VHTRATQQRDRASSVELDWVGSYTVAWPRIRCAVCDGTVPQRHGVALLIIASRPTCRRCFSLGKALGAGAPITAVRRVFEAGHGD